MLKIISFLSLVSAVYAEPASDPVEEFNKLPYFEMAEESLQSSVKMHEETTEKILMLLSEKKPLEAIEKLVDENHKLMLSIMKLSKSLNKAQMELGAYKLYALETKAKELHEKRADSLE